MHAAAADAFDVYLTAFLSQCRAPPLDLNHVTADVAGLTLLAQHSAWKHVVEVSARMLTTPTADPAFVMRLRLEGLFRVKMFDELTVLATDILAAEEAKGPAADRGSVYGMRLLLAEIKTMTGQGEQSMQLLYMFRDELEQLLAAQRGGGGGGGGSSSSSGSSSSGAGSSSSSSSSSSGGGPALQWWVWRISGSIINAAVRQVHTPCGRNQPQTRSFTDPFLSDPFFAVQRMWRIAVTELTGNPLFPTVPHL